MRHPFWREEKKPGTVSIKIHTGNGLNRHTQHRIEQIARQPKYIEELLEFREIIFHVNKKISAMVRGKYDVSHLKLP